MFKAVLFDLDGTLVNSLRDLANAANYALSFYGFDTYETEKYKYFVGNGIPNLITAILPQEHRDEQTHRNVMEKFFEYYRVHYADNTDAYDGIRELLAELKKRNIAFAVVTNKAQAAAEDVVNRIFPNTFKRIYGQRDGIPVKPDPTLALLAMKEMGVTPSQTIFAGDSSNDVKTGNNCGAYSVGVLWGFRRADELLEGGAKDLIVKPLDLLEIIDK